MANNVMLKHGLIAVSVTTVKATVDDNDSGFKTLCRGTDKPHDPVLAKAPLYCPECDNRDYGSFVKGKDLGDGTYAIVEAEAIAEAGATDSEKTELNITVHPAAAVSEHTMPSGRVYYLKEGKGSSEHYALMRELVRRHPEFAFVTTYAVRSKPALYRLAVFGEALMLTELAYPEKMREAPEITSTVNEGLLTMAEQLLASIPAEPFDAATYRDRRGEMLERILATATKVTLATDEDAAAPAAPIDLMAAMQAQLAAATKAQPKKRATRKKAS